MNEELTYLLDEYDYELPEELIAQEPIEPRDAARLMVVRRTTRTIEHRIFRELPSLLDPGDLLVVNDSRVLPARLFGMRHTGGKVEILLVQPLEGTVTWLVLARPARRLRPGETVAILPRVGTAADPASARIVERRSGDRSSSSSIPSSPSASTPTVMFRFLRTFGSLCTILSGTRRSMRPTRVRWLPRPLGSISPSGCSLNCVTAVSTSSR